jgi:hypothetical protein
MCVSAKRPKSQKIRKRAIVVEFHVLAAPRHLCFKHIYKKHLYKKARKKTTHIYPMCHFQCVSSLAVSSVNTPIYPPVDITKNTKNSVFKEHSMEKSRGEREAPKKSTKNKGKGRQLSCWPLRGTLCFKYICFFRKSEKKIAFLGTVSSFEHVECIISKEKRIANHHYTFLKTKKCKKKVM